MRATGWVFVFGVVASVAWLGTCSAGADESDVIASCGEAIIRRADLDKVVQRLGLMEMAAGSQRQRVEAAILEQLVDELLLRSELDRLGIRATRAEIEAGVTRLRDQVQGRGLEYEAFLAGSGRTAGDVEDQVALEVALEKFVRPQITAAALAEMYEQNRRELDGTRLRVSHIVLRPEAGGDGDLAAGLLERARAIRQEIMQGKLSFVEAARQYSAGPSRRAGGDLGWIGRDGPLIDAFASQAFVLAKGGVSAPFVTPVGVHILTVTGVEPGRIGIDAVRPRLEKLMAARLVRGLVAQGRQQTAVTFAAGVVHLDPATAGQPVDERPVVGGEN
jgi:parvulin-like peptidyl-prolyl isomerase